MKALETIIVANDLARNLLLANLVAVVAMPSSAQQPEVEKLVLEEVLVSARKREESLQDVSVAISAVSGSAIDDAHIRDSAELSKLVSQALLDYAGALK